MRESAFLLLWRRRTFTFRCTFSGHVFLPILLFAVLFLDTFSFRFYFSVYFFWTLFPSDFTFHGTFLGQKRSRIFSKKVEPKVTEKVKIGNQKVKKCWRKVKSTKNVGCHYNLVRGLLNKSLSLHPLHFFPSMFVYVCIVCL